MALTPSETRRLLDRHGIAPSRALGQNFVVDPNTIERVVALAAIAPGDAVIEVGPGLGALTTSLADAGASVVAVEVDAHLLPPLREVVGDRDVRILHADAMTLDWSEAVGDRRDWKLVANLPYNVATPLVLRVLDEVPAVREMWVMVQREVGERLVAAPDTRAMGIPSLRVAYWADAEIVAQVPASVFHPRPRVESVVVQVRRRLEPAAASDPDWLFRLIRTAFNGRRKMLRRSLAGLVDAGDLGAVGIRPESRPAELALDDWDRLAGATDPPEVGA